MNPTPPLDGAVQWALNILIRAPDHQIERHKDQMRLLSEQIARVLGQPTKSQIETADGLIRLIKENLCKTLEFFIRDHSSFILTSLHEAGNNTAIILSSRRSSDTGEQFLRLLACRHLALGRRQGTFSSKRTNAPGGKKAGVNHQIKDGLKRGEKILKNEDITELPELSLILLPVLPKMDHLYSDELECLGKRLATDQELKASAQSLAELDILHCYQRLYDGRINCQA